ncbi:MAG TPA: permease-like cell division protein FtsX [Melioribacteraceae bacterium]|nr:permease-like cell division protein FtsX [Melioribacteraceae bacterium]
MIKFYFKEAFKSLLRQKGSSLITIFILVIAILTSSSAILSIYLSANFSKSLIGSIKVNLFLQNNISESSKNLLIKTLRENRSIKSIDYIDKEKAKEEFIKETGDDFSSFLEINPLPESFRLTLNSEIVNLKKINNLIGSFKKLNFVEDVVYDYEYLFKIISLLNSAKTILYTISILTILISVYLVYATNKLIYNSRRETYTIMKLVGAKISAIKTPLYFSSIILGLTASTFSVILSFFFLLVLTNIINNVNFTKWIIIISTIMPIFGLFFGMMGGIFSTRSINLKIERG